MHDQLHLSKNGLVKKRQLQQPIKTYFSSFLEEDLPQTLSCEFYCKPPTYQQRLAYFKNFRALQC
jgi:hypothetical protein